MACRESGGSKILLCIGLVLVASCHCTRFSKLKALDKFRGNSTLSHDQPTGNALRYGRLLIGNSVQPAKLKVSKATMSLLDIDKDYQADAGWGQPKQPEKQDSSGLKPDDSAVEKFLKMEPKVECTGDSMKLQVRGSVSTPGSLFFVDRGSRLSPLPLSKLPSSCGYTIRSTQRDLVLAAPYDGCFVALEEDSYVLPLLWLGLPVRMSCPLSKQSSPNAPMVTCHVEGMVVKMEWTSAVKIKVHLNGNWEPLMKASSRCGFSVVEHPEGVVISVRYTPCLAKKDGMFTLELAGDGETKISCPSLAPAQPDPTKSPLMGLEQQTKTPSNGVYFSTPSSYTSIHSPEPAQPAIPQETGFPQTPEEPTEKPSLGPKDIYQPQLPYFPFYHNFFYPSPSNLDPTLNVQSTSPPEIEKNHQTVTPAHVPLNTWETQPEQIPVEREHPHPQATYQPNGQQKQPFYPFPFYVKPPYPYSVPPASRLEQKPLPPTAPPVVKTTKDHRRQPFYPFPVYPNPHKPEAPPIEPLVTKPSKGKLQEYLLPNPSQPPQEPVKPSASQPEGREHKPLYPIPAPKPPKSPQPEAPQGQVYLPFDPNTFYPQPEPEIKPSTNPTAIPEPSKSPQPEAPQRHIYLPFYPNPFQPQPEIKPTTKPAIPEPSKSPQPEAPQRGVEGLPTYLPFYPNPFQPQPEIKPTTKPAIPEPSKLPQPEAPQRQVFLPFYPNPFQPQPEIKPTTKPAIPEPSKSPQPEAPQRHVYLPFYPNPFQPQPEIKPTTKPAIPEPSKLPQPEAPQRQVFLPFYPNPFQPQPEIKPTTKPAIPEPSKSPQPEAPQRHVYLPFYPNPFQPQPEIKPTTKPAIPEPSKLPQPEAPQRQVFLPFYPKPFYPQLESEIQPPTKPAAVPKPPATETRTTYHQPSKMPGAGTDGKASAEKPVPSEWPLLVKPPEGQAPQPFNPYYHPLQPHLPQPVTLPPATFMQQPQHVTIPSSGHTPQESANSQPSDGGIVPKDPQLGSSLSPVYCSPFCASGFSNCCPQIAFHQHLHHIVPAGSATKDTPSVYTGLPFLPSVAYSGFANGFGPTPLPLKPTEATTTATFAPISHQSLQSGNDKPHFQPPDGNPAALPGSNPSKPTNSQQQLYHYFVPKLQYPYLSYQLQQEEFENLPQRPSPADSVPSKIHSPGNEPVNPMVPYNIQLPNQQNIKIPDWDMNNPSEPNLMSFISHLQQQDSAGDQGPTFNTAIVSNSNLTQSQTRHEQTVNAHSEPKAYVLLQHGPPGRQPSSFRQSLGPSQEKPQRPEWLGKGMPYPLPDNVNLIPGPGDELDNSAPGVPHFVPVHQDPSISVAHSKPTFFNSFKELWKPMTLQGASTRIQPHIPGKLFQRWSSAVDHQANGLTIQQEGRKQD